MSSDTPYHNLSPDRAAADLGDALDTSGFAAIADPNRLSRRITKGNAK